MSRHLLLTCITSLLLAACGGGSDDRGSKERDTARRDPRAGYFHEAERDRLDPALRSYDAASAEYYAKYDACNAESLRLFKAGRTPRQSVACHLRMTRGVITSVQQLQQALDDLDGEYREACDEQVAAFSALLDRFHAALTTLQGDWVAYGNGKPTPKIDSHTKVVDDLAAEYVEAVPSLEEACSTKSDRDKAEAELEAKG